MNSFREKCLVLLFFGVFIASIMLPNNAKPDSQIQLEYIRCLGHEKSKLPEGSRGYYITYNKTFKDRNIKPDNRVAVLWTKDSEPYLCFKTEKGFILVPVPHNDIFSGYKVDNKTKEVLEECYKKLCSLKHEIEE